MADTNKNFPLTGSNQNTERRSAEHLPNFFRTETNLKFLSSTFDQLIKPGNAEKVNGYFGRKQATQFRPTDFYIGDVSKQREDYQFEPAAVIQDDLENINFYGDYNDFINQIRNLYGNVENHSILNRQEYYTWNPHIDWDKFVNYREYYWLPNGPQSIPVAGDILSLESTYTVTNVDNLDNYGFVFDPDGFTQNPELTLYRGVTYRFEIYSPGLSFSLRSNRTTAKTWSPRTFYQTGETVVFNGSIYIAQDTHRSSADFDEDIDKWNLDTQFNLTNEVSQQGIEIGVIEFTPNNETPDFVYYVSDEDINAGGLLRIYDAEEATFVNVDRDIIGKASYTTGNGYKLSNGMKIYFQGKTSPEIYQEGFYYVEGVGESIELIPESNLTLSSAFLSDDVIKFDSEGFDTVPYSRAIGFPRERDYITINRRAKDGNLWSKYNRWFHRDVIEKSSQINQSDLVLDQESRAKRPIIEFEPGLKLYNFGVKEKQPVDIIDDFSTDVFSNIEGQSGYNIDGIDLTNGMRVLFTADPDIRVNGKIYEVRFIEFKAKRQIALVETDDTTPLENETVLIGQGNQYQGKVFYYDGTQWQFAQQKNNTNQSPLYDLFDCNEFSLDDQSQYPLTDFQGTKIFSYKQGNAIVDDELGFPLSYRNIENVGDIVFNFNLTSDSVNFCPVRNTMTSETTGFAYLRKYTDLNTYVVVNGWKKSKSLSYQPVIRLYEDDVETKKDFAVDVYDNSAELEDLDIKVFVNDSLQVELDDYEITFTDNQSVVSFYKNLLKNDVVKLKTTSSAAKNQNGFYEVPGSLEKNPQNDDITNITLGEINDHVATIVGNLEGFSGRYPGSSNLRDKGNVTEFGNKILKHSVPLNLPLYHLLDRDANIIKSLQFARKEYGKFKRKFMQLAHDLSFTGNTKDHVDFILQEMFKNKKQTDPFYFSDMVPRVGSKKTDYPVNSNQQKYFALSQEFSLSELSDRSVLVYKNHLQLIHNLDYVFNDQGFVEVLTDIARGDTITIYEYENTLASYVPVTPSKLGIYPAYQPQKVYDESYLETKEVIVGHDGSKILAFGDFRDDLIIELERRIFNNIKIRYNPDLFDLFDYIPGDNRNTGISIEKINDSLFPEFTEWLNLVDEDYTENTTYDRNNPFTWNYSSATDWKNDSVNGSWRQVYINAYDTDLPHLEPWKMQGFYNKPEWWEDEYGPSPYTSDNLLLWEDIEQGIIRKPGTSFEKDERFARPGITSHLPVDEHGNLVSPVYSRFIDYYNSDRLDEGFLFGDYSPVENAWRRSSEYPFAILLALIINQPSRVFASAFDRSRQKRDLTGQIIYEQPNRQLRTQDLIFPNTIEDNNRVYCSGLINFVRDYFSSSVTSVYENYKNHLRNIENKIGFKIAGYTSKDKFNLILDSRTPSNNGNVFVPPENYNIFLNTSTPIENIYYSGVIIEKTNSGFLIRGYAEKQPYFNYFKTLPSGNDTKVNVGGISSPVIYWKPNITITTGSVIEFDKDFYRTSETHETGNTFDESKFVRIPEIPIQGGRNATFRSRFEDRISKIRYGEKLETVQEVVDFILGYGEYLKKKGFVFDYFDSESRTVTDWETSAREFLFWTTQNWSSGSVISLSPGAFSLKFQSKNAVVDDIYDIFYGYGLRQVNGDELPSGKVSLSRSSSNTFEVKTKNTDEGIFGLRISLVQKEHAVILDNKTEFGDIIFDKGPGYRQERIRALGYRSADWDGSLNVPGFIFDDAYILNWQPWKDYEIGSLVRYKEFVYSARNRVAGSNVFNASDWFRLSEIPQKGLIPNFEYRTNQFADFYDLDTDNFDAEQQKFAQHLIGYQNRDYLANIINDDVSQYKFYQGFIQEKGTSNSLGKLFDVLSSADRESLEFYEEWAVRVGRYGATDSFKEVEFLVDESRYRVEPQTFELTEEIPKNATDLVYRITADEVYQKPNGYTNDLFPEVYLTDTFVEDAGYVHPDDIQYRIDFYSDLLGLEYNSIILGDCVWVGNEGLDWNIYTHVKTDLRIEFIEVVEENDWKGYRIDLANTDFIFDIGEIIGIFNCSNADGLYKIEKIENNSVFLTEENTAEIDENEIQGTVTRFISSRFENFEKTNSVVPDLEQGVNKLWIDKDSRDNWRVLENIPNIKEKQSLQEETAKEDEYAGSFCANSRNTVLAVGAPGKEKVYVYTRPTSKDEYTFVSELELDSSIASENTRFGQSVSVSEDGEYIAVGSPDASNVKTYFKGNFEESSFYSTNSIINFQGALWQATTDIQPGSSRILVNSFQSIPQIVSGEQQEDKILLTGEYPFAGVSNVDHILVKVPNDLYEGSVEGDIIELAWNQFSFSHDDDISIAKQPFDGSIIEIDNSTLSNKFTIASKIDSIIRLLNPEFVPEVGDFVVTETASGRIDYISQSELLETSLYINDQTGDFGSDGQISTRNGFFVGSYETEASKFQSESSILDGYLKLDLGFTYTVSNIVSDKGQGIVYRDFIPQGNSGHGFYNNILDFRTEIQSSRDSVASEIISLSYFGRPGPNGKQGEILSNKYVIRAPSVLTGDVNSSTEQEFELTPGDSFDLFYNQTESQSLDPSQIGLSYTELNSTQVVYDIWDGYFDIEITEDYLDQPLEPKVGLTVRDTDFGGTAEIVFYQKFNNRDIRIFVNNIEGRWARGSRFGEGRNIEFLADGSGDPEYDPAGGSREFGLIISRSIGLEEAQIGRLIVIEAPNDIQLANSSSVENAEYWFYKNIIVNGDVRTPSIPSSNNNEWLQVYSIPALRQGETSNLDNQGLYTIFERTQPNAWSSIGSFIVPETAENLRLGTQIEMRQFNQLYRLFVSSAGNQTSETGQVHVIKNGQENGLNYSWELGKNKKYRGLFTATSDYLVGDVVFKDSLLYQAKTNVVAGAFNENDWSVTDTVDYLGFIPNTTGNNLSGIDTVDSDKLERFAVDYDVSKNGETVVALARYDNEPNKILIYRNVQGLYILTQTIDESNSFVSSDIQGTVSISPNSEYISVGSINNSDNALDQGAVYLFKHNQGFYEDFEKIYSPQGERAELFGSHVEITDQYLFVTAKNGSGIEITVFDSAATTFDQALLRFVTLNENGGVVYVYELFDEHFLYSEFFDLNNVDVRYFGRNIQVVENNIYVGLPKMLNSNSTVGSMINFTKDQSSWTNKRLIKPTVDTDKIKKVLLYDTKKNVLLENIDYIDIRQGKVPGPAEQEIDFKTYYDPAVYNKGSVVQINASQSWSSKHVGKIWWDLSTAKVLNPYMENVTYSVNQWNTLFSSQNSIDIYEWVESSIKPSEWDSISETENGYRRNITGRSKYGDEGYVEKIVYSEENETFQTLYYFWVKNRKTVPANQTRRLSANDIGNLIEDPLKEGYKFITFVAPNEFALYNCENLIKDRDVSLAIQYYTLDNQQTNIHNQYELISDGLSSSRPSRDVEQKWFDSLIGFDSARRFVPASDLTAKEKYGTLNQPRQSWFVNRIEALKECVDRINRVVRNNLIVESKDISRLMEFDEVPIVQSRKYDRKEETLNELDLIGIANIEQSILDVIIIDGKISDVSIIKPGKGYQNPPLIRVVGTGSEGELTAQIDSEGSITNVEIKNRGSNYSENTQVIVRPFSVLVENDSTIDGKWAIYELTQDDQWKRVESQGYDVTRYWNYIDWYRIGYGKFTEIDYIIDYSYQLDIIKDSIGDIVKITNVGSGGWLLLEKTGDTPGVDYTQNYKTIGRQNGTIQLSSLLYDVTENLTGFDVTQYDTIAYDALPSREIRIILEALRDSIFVDELSIEYNQLFFATLRYVFSEQNNVDWAFKTSFVKAKHNVGYLEKKITFKNDNLQSYEQYFDEVKPYKTTIREYVSDYNAIDNTNSVVTDFDLSPRYVSSANAIEPYDVKLNGNKIVTNSDLSQYPERHWLDNVGFVVTDISIGDPGSGYISAPILTITGGGGENASAVASIGRSGEITSAKVINPGRGFITAPKIRVNGSVRDGGRPAVLSAEIGNSPIRTINTGIKFDRISGKQYFNNLDSSETFVSSGSKIEYELSWPIDLQKNNTVIKIDGIEVLRGRYSVTNTKDQSKSYTRNIGKIIFEESPANGKIIEISYKKSLDLLDAQDRILLLKNEDSELSSYMEGVDYGGVSVDSINWQITSGWDTDSWTDDSWDEFDDTFDDHVFYRKTVILEFPAELNAKAYSIDTSSKLFQDSTLAEGYVKQITPTSIVLDSNISYQWNTIDNIRIDKEGLVGDSTTSNILLSDDSQAIPSQVTNILEFSQPLASSSNYNVYIKEITDNGLLVKNTRLDDENYGTDQQTNNSAILKTIEGDDSTLIFDIDEYGIDTSTSTTSNTLTVIIRKSTSDGSKSPLEKFYDSTLSGGDLAYTTATGLKSDDIIIEGDGFITPITSKGPEELVPGQVIDTLDLQVYERPVKGSSDIVNLNYIADGNQYVYSLTESPIKEENVFVKINNQIISNDFYVIDYDKNTVNLIETPENGDRINILVIGYSGQDILGTDSFTGDGNTIEFLTGVRWENDLEALVTVNGIKENFEIVKSDNTYELPDNVIIKFETPPLIKSSIFVLISKSSNNTDKNFSEVTIDEFVADGTTVSYTLENNIFSQQPANAQTLVTVGNKLLSAGYSEIFEITRSRRYTLNNNQIPPSTANLYGVEVYLNGRRLEPVRQFNFISSGAFNQVSGVNSSVGSTIELKPGVGNIGDELKVFVIEDAEYRFGYFDLDNFEFIPQRGEDSTFPVLNLDEPYNPGDIIRVYNFTNHDSQGIDRFTLEVENNLERLRSTPAYYFYKELTNGVINLRKPAENSKWVWVAINNRLLDPNVDYKILNQKQIKLSQSPNIGDKIDVFHIAESPMYEPIAFRQFKDMLNNVHYKKIGKGIKLENDLTWYDKEIFVQEGDNLPEPKFNTREPGVIFVEGERIEYFSKTGNILKQLRRGTLGTGIKDTYKKGTEVYEQGLSKSIPYKDTTEIRNFSSSGDTEIDFPFSIDSINEIEIFIAGSRLRKTDIPVFDKSISLDSPEGDIIQNKEFDIDTDRDKIIFKDAPLDGTDITIIKKQGKLWNDLDTRLADSNTDIARFLLNK